MLPFRAPNAVQVRNPTADDFHAENTDEIDKTLRYSREEIEEKIKENEETKGEKE